MCYVKVIISKKILSTSYKNSVLHIFHIGHLYIGLYTDFLKTSKHNKVINQVILILKSWYFWNYNLCLKRYSGTLMLSTNAICGISSFNYSTQNWLYFLTRGCTHTLQLRTCWGKNICTGNTMNGRNNPVVSYRDWMNFSSIF